MENKNSYTIVGMFFIVCLTALGIFMWWMSSKGGVNEHYRPYYIETTDLPAGIKVDSSVKFIGVPAGIVKKIGFANEKDAIIEIKMLIKDNLPIKHDSKASIEIQALSGISTINISRGSKTSKVFSKDEKPVLKLEASLLDKLGNNAENIAQKISNSLKKLDEFMTPENISKFQSILISLNHFTDSIGNQENLNHFSSSLKNIDEISTKINSSDIKGVVKNANLLIKNSSKLVSSANITLKDFDNTQKMIKTRIARGDYNLRDILAPTLNESSQAIFELKKVLKELKYNLYKLEDDPYEFFFKNTKEGD